MGQESRIPSKEGALAAFWDERRWSRRDSVLRGLSEARRVVNRGVELSQLTVWTEPAGGDQALGLRWRAGAGWQDGWMGWVPGNRTKNEPLARKAPGWPKLIGRRAREPIGTGGRRRGAWLMRREGTNSGPIGLGEAGPETARARRSGPELSGSAGPAPRRGPGWMMVRSRCRCPRTRCGW
jgi:hypothetical protein